MIELIDLQKSYFASGQKKIITDSVSMVLPSHKSIALVGRNGAGKSSLLRMIAGTDNPDSGVIKSNGTISWPVGFAGSFHGELTGAQNVRFIARIYGVDTDDLIDYVEDFAELGPHFHMPFRTYSSGMRSRLAFGASMGIHFDTYLVDEVTSVGDADFRRKSEEVFNDRMSGAGAIVVSHSLELLSRICESGMLLEQGVLSYFEDVNQAIAAYRKLLAAA